MNEQNKSAVASILESADIYSPRITHAKKKRTVFTYKQKNASSTDEDTYTQFAYVCKKLGMELESNSVSQANFSCLII